MPLTLFVNTYQYFVWNSIISFAQNRDFTAANWFQLSRRLMANHLILFLRLYFPDAVKRCHIWYMLATSIPGYSTPTTPVKPWTNSCWPTGGASAFYAWTSWRYRCSIAATGNQFVQDWSYSVNWWYRVYPSWVPRPRLLTVRPWNRSGTAGVTSLLLRLTVRKRNDMATRKQSLIRKKALLMSKNCF